MKNWKTTFLGGLAGFAQLGTLLSHAGFQVGHWGGTDFLQLAAAIATAALGLHAQDKQPVQQ
jgi:hypothetical protein